MIFLAMGITIIFLDRKALLNRTFFALNLSLFFWSFFMAISTIAPDRAGCIFWSKMAGFGYCFFPSIALHFFLVYAKKENWLKKWWLNILIYVPAVVLFVQAVRGNLFVRDFLFNQYGWVAIPNVTSTWFWVFLLCIAATGMVNIFLAFSVFRKSSSRTERKQSEVILISTVISFTAGIVMISLTKVFIKIDIPDITVVTLLIWLIGILYSILKYRLMVLSPTIAAESILHTIIDSVILVDPKGLITYVNSETSSLLGYDKASLLGKPFEMLFPKDIKQESEQVIRSLIYGSIRNKDTFFLSKDGIRIPILLSASVCNDNEGSYLGFVALSRDITLLKDAEGRIRHLALHDVLTNLPNRALLKDRLSVAIARSKRNKTYLAFAIIDVDRFKEINDVYGHNVGDLLLIEIANRLSATVRESDVVARLGGDEFVILQSDLVNKNDCESVLRRCIELVSQPYYIDAHELHVTASAGISLYPDDGSEEEDLLKCADLAMYSAKSGGKNNYQFYVSSMSSSVNKRAIIEERLRKSITNDELFLLYQPILDIHSGKIIGVEALVRWMHPELGIITPDEFIPIAEADGFILELGEWVLRTACFQARKWQIKGQQPIYISVNISARQFYPQNLSKTVQNVLSETGLDAENLLLEITESTAMHNLESTASILTELDHLNVKTVIDDFGTGYSSLLYLRSFPIYAIKIDKCFIQEINKNPEYISVISAIIAMAHSIHLKVIAEGIEEQGQLETLQSLKQDFIGSSVCDEGQGYLFSKPVYENKITDMLYQQINADNTSNSTDDGQSEPESI